MTDKYTVSIQIVIFLYFVLLNLTVEAQPGCDIGPPSATTFEEEGKSGAAIFSGVGVIKEYRKGHGGRVECVYAEVSAAHLDTGTGITPAMKEHVRLQDANNISDQPAQVVLKKLGGPGNVTYNVFPQNGKRVNTQWVNRNQKIYDDLKKSSNEGNESYFYKLTYKFQYDNQSARPKRPTGWTFHIIAPNGTTVLDKYANPIN